MDTNQNTATSENNSNAGKREGYYYGELKHYYGRKKRIGETDEQAEKRWGNSKTDKKLMTIEIAKAIVKDRSYNDYYRSCAAMFLANK